MLVSQKHDKLWGMKMTRREFFAEGTDEEVAVGLYSSAMS